MRSSLLHILFFCCTFSLLAQTNDSLAVKTDTQLLVKDTLSAKEPYNPLAGFTDDEFFGDGDTPIISNDRLIDAQRSAQRNKDVSLIVAIAFYLVNIIDANVDAHLRQYDVSPDLSLTPNFEVNPINTQPQYGLALKLKLK